MALSQALLCTQHTALILVEGLQPFILAHSHAEGQVSVDHSADSQGDHCSLVRLKTTKVMCKTSNADFEAGTYK